MSKELNTAIRAAIEAGKIQQSKRDAATLNIEKKGDRSPVTEVDKRCEECIREIIQNAFPDDGFLGEESGATESSNARRWIVDPLDGTRPYIRGIPTYSVLIALEEGGIPTIGVIHLPAMGITCYASKGGGAFIDGEKIGVSKTDKLSDAMGSALGIIEYADKPLGRGLLDFMRSLDYVYGFMDAFSYVLLASGKIDACISLFDQPWDSAAAACIITEAGGKFSSITGEPTVHSGSFVVTNGILHDKVLGFFGR